MVHLMVFMTLDQRDPMIGNRANRGQKTFAKSPPKIQKLIKRKDGNEVNGLSSYLQLMDRQMVSQIYFNLLLKI